MSKDVKFDVLLLILNNLTNMIMHHNTSNIKLGTWPIKSIISQDYGLIATKYSPNSHACNSK